MTTFRPISDPSSRWWRSAIREFSRTIEFSISARSISHPSATAVYGPMYASFSTAPSPIATGPWTRQRSSRAPFATETRPSSSESTTSPSITGSTASSRSRLVSSMSSHLPVSFHQPVTTCGSTRFPWSISAWMASVISYSPRPDGSSVRQMSKMPGWNM